MKRSIFAVTVVSLAALASYALFAQAQPAEPGMMPDRPMGNGTPQMCPMCSTVAGAMMQKALVATPDGGVIVMAAGKLMKFDAQLNKVHEAEIVIDMEQMQQKIQQMMQNCPMHQQMMQRMQTRQGQSTTESAPQARAQRNQQPQNP